ncbi:hypothetical protein BGZ92_004620, partial [Podila epicladia]
MTAKTTATTSTTATATTGSGRSVVPVVHVVVNDPETELKDLRMLRDALARGNETQRELDVARRTLIDTRLELRHVADRLELAESHAGDLQAAKG